MFKWLQDIIKQKQKQKHCAIQKIMGEVMVDPNLTKELHSALVPLSEIHQVWLCASNRIEKAVHSFKRMCCSELL